MAGKRLPKHSGAVILGADPGLATYGVSALQILHGGTERLLAVQSVSSPMAAKKTRRREGIRVADEDLRRLRGVVEFYEEWIQRFQPILIAAERYQPFPQMRVSAKTHIRVALGIGALFALSVRYDIPYLDYSPSDLKAAVGAPGGSKADVAMAVENRFHLFRDWPRVGGGGKNAGLVVEHAADAVAVAVASSNDPAVQMRLRGLWR